MEAVNEKVQTQKTSKSTHKNEFDWKGLALQTALNSASAITQGFLMSFGAHAFNRIFLVGSGKVGELRQVRSN